jgi:uncharacterized membrane protein
MKNTNTEERIMAKFHDSMRRNENAFLGVEKRKKELEEKEDFLLEYQRVLKFYTEDSKDAHGGTSEYIMIDQFEDEIYQEETKLRETLKEVNEELKKKERELYMEQDEIHRQCSEDMNKL